MTTRHRQLCKDIENDVRESGRSVLCIGGEVDSPPFAYTIGNALKGLPELLMIGTRIGGSAQRSLRENARAWARLR